MLKIKKKFAYILTVAVAPIAVGYKSSWKTDCSQRIEYQFFCSDYQFAHHQKSPILLITSMGD
ncbi:MAG: hypothetical protein VKL00_04835 [Synechococcales bacterium]|nr:hypothetical protein [Synechococcales bacterium]